MDTILNLEECSMDPVTSAIVAALAAGVTTSAGEVGKKVVVDAYEALKTAIKQKLGVDSEVVESVEKLEKNPKSAGRKATLNEEVTAAQLDQDPEIVSLSNSLLEQLKSQPGGTQLVQQATGSYIAQAAQDSTASVNVSHPESS
jgi:hypothetical protein